MCLLVIMINNQECFDALDIYIFVFELGNKPMKQMCSFFETPAFKSLRVT